MKKSVIMNSGMAALAIVMFCGCQIPGPRPSNKSLIKATMANWKAALLARDLDKLMSVYSDNYVSTRGDGKDSVREFMTGVFEKGWLDNIKVNIEGAKTAIKGSKATFAPVEFVSDRGTRTMEFTLQKEKGTWLIVGSKRQEQ